jgi:hypothetical protein
MSRTAHPSGEVFLIGNSECWITAEIGQPPLADLHLNRKVIVGYEAQIGLEDSVA